MTETATATTATLMTIVLTLRQRGLAIQRHGHCTTKMAEMTTATTARTTARTTATTTTTVYCTVLYRNGGHDLHRQILVRAPTEAPRERPGPPELATTDTV